MEAPSQTSLCAHLENGSFGYPINFCFLCALCHSGLFISFGDQSVEEYGQGHTAGE